MLMHGQAYPTIFYSNSYRIVSTFYHQSRYDAKNLSFSAVEAAVLMWQNAVWSLLALTHTAPNVLAFESFLMLSNVSKLLCNQLLMILQVQLTPDMSIHEVMLPLVHQWALSSKGRLEAIRSPASAGLPSGGLNAS